MLPHAGPKINHQGLTELWKKLMIVINTTRHQNIDETGRIILDKALK